MTSDPVHAWLLRLCDPAGPPGMPTKRLDPPGMVRLLRLADEHAVTGAVLANVGRITLASGRDRIVRGATGPAGADVEAAIATARDRWFGLNVQSLVLRQRAGRIAEALAEADVPAGIVKGEDFADRLYAPAGLRPFRDIDLMVPRERMAAAAEAMESLGFREAGCGRHVGDYGERTWDSDDRPLVRVDVHWNLINSPAQRRRSSLPSEAFPWEARAGSRLLRTTPAALVLIAAVHAVLGHRFDRLQQLCDIRQICRGAAGPVDVDWLREAAARHGVETAVAGGLEVTARLLDDGAVADVRRRLASRGGAVATARPRIDAAGAEAPAHQAAAESRPRMDEAGGLTPRHRDRPPRARRARRYAAWRLVAARRTGIRGSTRRNHSGGRSVSQVMPQ